MAYSPNVLKGKVFCARCGFLMHRHRQNKDGIYWYRCQSQWKYSKGACVQVSVKESDLITEIMGLLKKQFEAILSGPISINNPARKQEQDMLEAELRNINQSLDKDGRMLRSLYESMVSGIITSGEFVQLKSDYEAKIIALSKHADEIRDARRNAESREEEYRDVMEVVSAAVGSGNLNAEIIEKLVDKILVSPDKNFEIVLRYSDEFREVCA